MKMICNVPDEAIKCVKDGTWCGSPMVEKMIATGIPLPKGHGRLIDADKVADRLEELRNNWDYYGNEYESGIYTGCDYSLDEVMDAPTIIEADKESEEV